MKKVLLLLAITLASATSMAKDIKTVKVTTTPQMHCENCEKKIKDNLRFEKGIKKIETSIKDQTVTLEYDADKTSSDNLIKAFSKFGYQATEIKKENEEKKEEKKEEKTEEKK